MAGKEEIMKLMRRLSAAYPHSNLSADTYSIYAEALADVPMGILQLAVVQAATTSEFFPTLHKLHETIAEIIFGGTPTAEEAWEDVVRKLQGNPMKWKDEPLIERVVNLVGGWYGLKTSTNAMADRGQFLKMYANLRERERQNAMLPSAVKQLRLNMQTVQKQLED